MSKNKEVNLIQERLDRIEERLDKRLDRIEDKLEKKVNKLIFLSSLADMFKNVLSRYRNYPIRTSRQARPKTLAKLKQIPKQEKKKWHLVKFSFYRTKLTNRKRRES
jgi:hypothetical protein